MCIYAPCIPCSGASFNTLRYKTYRPGSCRRNAIHFFFCVAPHLSSGHSLHCGLCCLEVVAVAGRFQPSLSLVDHFYSRNLSFSSYSMSCRERNSLERVPNPQPAITARTTIVDHRGDHSGKTTNQAVYSIFGSDQVLKE